MIYLAGDNDLSPEMVRALQRMKDAKVSRKVNVIVEMDTMSGGARFFELNRSRFSEVKIDRTWPSRSVTKDEIERENSGAETDSLRGLRNLLKWGVKDFPAEHYMLILFGHGPIIRGAFLQDSNPPSYLELPDFAGVLGEFFNKKNKLDILGLHNCVMNGVELLYQLRDTADYILGSQGLVLRVGWPYQRLLNAITMPLEDSGADAATPSQVAARLLRVCAKHNFDFYRYMNRSFDQALSRAGKSDEIAAALKGNKEKPGLARLLTRHLEMLGQDDREKRHAGRLVREAVCLARLEAQSFWQSQFVDLQDFCALLADKCRFFERLVDRDSAAGAALDSIADACENVKQAIENAVRGNYYLGPERQYSNGLSVYFPWAQPFDTVAHAGRKCERCRNAFAEYKDYDFARDAHWGKFLTTYFAATMRSVRDQEGEAVLFPTSRQFAESITYVGKNSADVGKNSADVGKNSADVGKNSADVGKNSADVGKNSADVGKNSADVNASSCFCVTVNFPLKWQPGEQLQKLLQTDDNATLPRHTS
jgi:hypothetical protein